MFSRLTVSVAKQAGKNFSTTSQNNVKVAVCGASGGIGQPLSLLLKQSPLVTELSLYDIVHTPGVAADLSHIDTPAKVTGFNGAENLEKALKGSQIVVIATNDPKKKDANKDEKFLANANIIRVITCNIAHLCPKAFVAIVTNPVNSCVPVVAEVFKACGTLNPRKIFGVTTLTSVRARSFIGQHCNVNPKEIELPIIGGNCEHTCVPILSCCNVKIPLEKYEELVLKIIEAEIDLRKIKNSTHGSTLAMAWSASRFVNCLCKAIIGEVKPRVNTFVHCNITDTKYLNCPVILGKDGVHEVLQLPKMNEFENCLLSKALPILKEEIKRGEDFIAKFVKDNGGGSGSEKQSTTKCDTGKKTDSKDSKKK